MSSLVVAAPVAAQCPLTFTPMGVGIPPGGVVNVFALAPTGDGGVVAGGQFQGIGGVATQQIARWDGASWSALGDGLPSFNAVYALCRRPNGDVIAGGQSLGSPALLNIARWDGVTWSPLGTGVSGYVRALANLANGDLAVAGNIDFAGGQMVNRIARWNGTTWSAIGAGFEGLGPFTSVGALATMPDGDLIAGGTFTASGGQTMLRVARWNGTTWSPLGAGFDGAVTSLLVLPNGDLIAGGVFTASGSVDVSRIARFDGTAWGPLGTGLAGNPGFGVNALASLPNGDVVAGGLFRVGSGPLVGLARWDGTAWSELVSGFSGAVATLAFDPQSMLFVGGTFFQGPQGRGITRLTSACPANVVNQPSGCVAGGGHLEVTSRAWLGSTWRAAADGLPSAGLAMSVFGLNGTAVPLSALSFTAIPGCKLLVAPQAVGLHWTNGTLDVELGVPESPALLGLSFRHQVVTLAFSSWFAVAATNAVTATVGSF